MNWLELTDPKQLYNEILEGGEHLIFKHSRRCSISVMALKRLERSEFYKCFKGGFWILDVLKSKNLSLSIAAELNIRHESPQVIVFSNKRVIHHASHLGIEPETINKLMS
jgi:bacillithiol system protein YtxJ